MWGLFDHDLYVDYNGERTGPYYPVSGPIPLNRYRSFKKTRADETADRLHQLAAQLGLLMAALTGETDVRLVEPAAPIAVPRQPFDAAAGEYQYPTAIAAKLAMADIAYDVLLETGVLIQPLPVWEDEWEHPENSTYPALLQNRDRLNSDMKKNLSRATASRRDHARDHRLTPLLRPAVYSAGFSTPGTD